MSHTRPDLSAIVARLLAQADHVIDLDTLGDEIGDAAVSTDDIDRIIAALEAEGRQVGAPEAATASADLGRVLRAARGLRASLGRTPTSTEIATAAALPLAAVRRALLFVRVVQR